MTTACTCDRPWTGFELTDHLGDVRPCCWGKISCGNINEQTPDEIWNGDGFNFYREMMRAGTVETICSPSCPILLGQYTERGVIPPPEFKEASGPVIETTPLYLRVVPTTKCNLRCTMCYQAGSPETRLPDRLFEILAPWLAKANELLILGGETFIAKECLEWIERITPESHPNCQLAAITNGLGFTPSVCKLIVDRQWSWILISIDAASESVYRQVRGGDFTKIIGGLHAICDVRSVRPFELRLGFILQRSTLHDALDFVDLCADFNATPQFTLVAGDWHVEAPTNNKEFEEFVRTTELIDKRLAERGFSAALISTLLASLKEKQTFWNSRPSLSLPTSFLALPNNRSKKVEAFGNLTVRTTGTALSFEVIGHIDSEEKSRALSSIRRARATSATISIPFFSHGKSVSIIDVCSTVDWLQELASHEAWGGIRSELDLAALGFDVRDCSPPFEVCAQSHVGQSDLAVVTPICNRSNLLPLFLKSLLPQLGPRDELILVDDGSVDESASVALRCIRSFSGNPNFKIIQLHRRQKYTKGTFTFGAGLARQIGVNSTTADMLLFLDPDQLVAGGCIENHRFFLNRGLDVVMGDRRELDTDIDTPWRALRAKALSARPEWWLSFCTANVSVRRHKFDDAGGFDPSLQYWGLDDTDLGFRLFANGARSWHTLRSQVVHLDAAGSGGGTSLEEKSQAYRLHLEVMFRKYLSSSVLDAFSFLG